MFEVLVFWKWETIYIEGWRYEDVKVYQVWCRKFHSFLSLNMKWIVQQYLAMASTMDTQGRFIAV